MVWHEIKCVFDVYKRWNVLDYFWLKFSNILNPIVSPWIHTFILVNTNNISYWNHNLIKLIYILKGKMILSWKTKNLVVGSYPIVNKTQQQRSSLRKNMPCIVNFFLQSFFGFKNNIGILDRWTNTDTCLLRFQKICWPWKHELKNFTCFKKLPKYIPS